MTDARPSGGNLRRGLRGSLDLPAGTITDPGSVQLAGWVFHEHAEVVLVVLHVDGRVVGTTGLGIDRPDVAALHAGASLRSGWSTTLALPTGGDTVTLTAHALVSDTQQGRTVLLPFGERVVDVRASRARGQVLLPDTVSAGTFRVTGTADISPALARVEVAVGDGRAVTARTSLPSPSEQDASPEASLRGFSATLEVPDGLDTVDVRVTAVATDGTRAELPTTPVPVEVAAPAGPGDRARTRAERLARRLEVQRAAYRDAPSGRVLVAAHDLGIGGAQNYLDALMHGLHEHGVRFCVVAGSDGPLLSHVEATYGAPVLVVGQAPAGAELLDTQVRLIADFAIEHGASAVLANTLVTFPAVLAAARLGIPATWAVHESFSLPVFWHEYLGRPADPAILAATREALAGCDEVLFEAESTRALYRDLVADDAAALVPYGLDVEAFDRDLATTGRAPAREELGIAQDQRVLVCVGTAEPRKGQLMLARAFGRLDPALRAGSSLHLVGASDTAYSVALRDHVRAAGLPEVHVVDADPDIVRWYAAADVLVSASDVESMPRTMLEAMLAARPVAATAAFGVGELVEDGVSGWLCEPGDLRGLTEVLTAATTADDATLTRMGAAARARVLADHASSGYVDHVLSWLHAHLGEPGARP